MTIKPKPAKGEGNGKTRVADRQTLTIKEGRWVSSRKRKNKTQQSVPWANIRGRGGKVKAVRHTDWVHNSTKHPRAQKHNEIKKKTHDEVQGLGGSGGNHGEKPEGYK